MRRVAIINQKGGVGKTTTTVNLGAALARRGHRVLLLDLDPQCNLTVHLDLDPLNCQPSLYELFQGKVELGSIVRPTGEPRLFVAPGSVDMAGCELELVNMVGREVLLRDAFETAIEKFGGEPWDWILVDCPPSLGLLSLNALVACNELFVPIQAEFFALQGLGKLMDVIQLVRRRLNPDLGITAMMSTRHDPQTKLSRAVIDDIKSHFGDAVLNTVIRRNVKLAEAPSHGKTIFQYDAKCPGAQDYDALADELLARGDRQPESTNDTAPAAPVKPATPAWVDDSEPADEPPGSGVDDVARARQHPET